MPKLLIGSDLEEAISWMEQAVHAATEGTCDKDKRGVVIVKNGILIGKGANGPPQGFPCTPSYCKEICSIYAVHAEMRAVAWAVKQCFGQDIQGSTMYHARTIDGKLVDSRRPRCAQCSKHLIEFGIERFVLKHKEGYCSYDTLELHRLSLEYTKSQNKQPDPFDKNV